MSLFIVHRKCLYIEYSIVLNTLLHFINLPEKENKTQILILPVDIWHHIKYIYVYIQICIEVCIDDDGVYSCISNKLKSLIQIFSFYYNASSVMDYHNN